MRHQLIVSCGLAVLVSIPARAADTSLQLAVEAPTRTPKFVARDSARHPAEELGFFGVKPNSTVVEIWPGGGYWTQILAPYLRDSGTYYVAAGVSGGDKLEKYFAPSGAFKAMLASNPAVYGHVRMTEFGAHHSDIAPAGSADFVLTFRNLHNWMAEGDTDAMLAAINRALKPGGVLGIEDHRANTNAAQDPKAASGYVRQDYAIKIIEAAGFKLVASSEMDANTHDTADWPQGVWTLPPTYALGATDHARYAAIGEADNFVLKFRKLGS